MADASGYDRRVAKPKPAPGKGLEAIREWMDAHPDDTLGPHTERVALDREAPMFVQMLCDVRSELDRLQEVCEDPAAATTWALANLTADERHKAAAEEVRLIWLFVMQPRHEKSDAKAAIISRARKARENVLRHVDGLASVISSRPDLRAQNMPTVVNTLMSAFRRFGLVASVDESVIVETVDVFAAEDRTKERGAAVETLWAALGIEYGYDDHRRTLGKRSTKSRTKVSATKPKRIGLDVVLALINDSAKRPIGMKQLYRVLKKHRIKPQKKSITSAELATVLASVIERPDPRGAIGEVFDTFSLEKGGPAKPTRAPQHDR